jgi:hypothetical protein
MPSSRISGRRRSTSGSGMQPKDEWGYRLRRVELPKLALVELMEALTRSLSICG